MDVHQRSVRLGAAFVVAVLAGCAPLAPKPAQNPSPPEASAADVSDGIPIELSMTGVAMPAGRYTFSGFKPAITIELDGSWQTLNLLEGLFDLGHVTEVDDITILRFAILDGLYADDDAITPPPASAAQAVATIKANPNLRVIETSASRIGGLNGAQVTLETATGASDRPVFSASSSPVVVEEDRRLWIAFFETTDGLLAIIVSGTIVKWDEALGAAEPPLESVTIGGSE